MKIRKITLILSAILCFSVAMTGCGSNSTQESKPTEKVTIKIAAAASLKNAFEDKLIPAFEKANSGITVEGTYDSSGKLQTQIEQGLGADLFFSAATKQMTALCDESMVDKDTVANVLENKIVLIVSKDNESFKDFKDITNAKTVAVGDPDSVPAGQYAKEALESLGIWDAVSAKSSLGTNVTQVLNWVAEGSADAGIVYATDAASMSDKVKVVAEAPEGSLKKQVVYPLGVVSGSTKKVTADKFMKYLQSDEAKAVFKDYGFTPMNK